MGGKLIAGQLELRAAMGRHHWLERTSPLGTAGSWLAGVGISQLAWTFG